MTNWSLALNVLFLIGAVVALFILFKSKQQASAKQFRRYSEPREAEVLHDDIIAVRRLDNTQEASPAPFQLSEQLHAGTKPISLMMFLLAKNNQQLGGYDLLQTLLAAGLRFGDQQLFHRHQFSNGQGPIICSLAAATDAGTFDLQNMATFREHGLCFFMTPSGNASIDSERFEIMLETATQLSKNLDTYLLDDTRQPWSEESVSRYQMLLGITD